MLKGYYRKGIFGVEIQQNNECIETKIVLCGTSDVLYENKGTDRRYVIKETEKFLNTIS